MVRWRMIEFFIFVITTLLKSIHGTTGNNKMKENLETVNILFTGPTWLWLIRNKYLIYKQNPESVVILPDIEL